jgi:hypothetical protein
VLKRWLDAGRCLVGVHQGEWVQVSPVQCELVQTCLVCGTESRRVDHAWRDWTSVPDDPCAEARSCARCGEHEHREEHQPGSWTYEREGDCRQVQACERCGRQYEATRVEHAWGDWTYSETHRSPVRRCDRCGVGVSYLGAALDTDDSDHETSPSLSTSPNPSPSPGKDAEYRAMFAAIRSEYEAQVSRGQIPPSRQPRYAAMLDELEGIIATPAPDLPSLQAKARRIQEMLAGFSSALMNPSRPEAVAAPADGSRAAMLLSHLRTLHAYVMSEVGDNQLTGDGGAALMQLVGSLQRCRDALAAPMTDAALRQFEVESLRPLVVAIRQFSLRAHLTLARPVWPSPVVTQHPDAIFYAGGDDVLALVRAAGTDRDLRILVPQRHKEPASLRWNQLREAAVAIFDFTRYERSNTLDVTAPIASVAYEFGIALVLGRPVVIVADASRGLPFDLDIDPVVLGHDDRDESTIADAIDHALYSLQRGPAGSSVGTTLEWLQTTFGHAADMQVRASISAIDDEARRDPVRARLVVSTILGYLGADAPQLLFPAWPGAYPSSQARSCFHVTAFGPPWARQARELVRAACPDGLEYVRGDQMLEPDIIRSIWDEICTATHIVVDVTGLNANVLVELGIAHALGRNVLLISQDQDPERYFRALAKHRVHAYSLDTADERDALQARLRAFFAT